MAAGEKIDRTYRGSLLKLTLLAPELLEPILDGRAADRVALPALLEPTPLVRAHQQERLLSAQPSQGAKPRGKQEGPRLGCSGQSYRVGSQRLAMRQATVKAGLKTLPMS